MDLFSGAGSGAASGSFGGPAGAAIGAGLGLVGGLIGGHAKAKEAARQAKLSAKLARIDTEYSPLVKPVGYHVQQDTSPDIAGQGISGAFTGGLQGLNVYRGLQGDKMNEEKLNLLKSLSGVKAPLALNMAGTGGGPSLGNALNSYTNYKNAGIF